LPDDLIAKPPAPPSFLPDRFKLITWNCRTLFGSTQGSSEQAVRVRATHFLLSKLAASADIILLQETHGCEADLASLRRKHLEFVFRGSFCESHSAGGLVFAIRKQFLGKYGDADLLATVLRVRHVVPGRIAFITLPANVELTRLAVFNVHIDPGVQADDPLHSTTKLSMLHKLFGAIPPLHSTHSMLAGDWNTVEVDDPRFHPAENKFVPDLTSHSKLLENKLAGFTELHQQAFTRRQCTDRSISVLSRIDRIYSNCPTCELLDRHPLTSTVGLVTVMTSPSDHVPVSTCFSPPSSGPPEFPGIPVWVTKHAEFPGAVEEMWGCVKHLVMNPMERLTLAKDILHSAAVLTKRKAAEIGANTTAEKLHWSLLAYRGVRRGADGDSLVHRSAAAFPVLGDWLPSGSRRGDTVHLAKLIAELSANHFDEEIAEVEADAQLPRPKVRARLSQLHVLAATWRSHRRRISLSAVTDPDGIPQSCPEAAAKLLEDHWKPVFAEKVIAAEAAILLMPFIQKVPPGLSWAIDRSGFYELMAKPRDSAPGPDGIPYGAWRAAGTILYDVMFEAFVAFTSGSPLPPQFNDCNLAFIPKGDNPEDFHLVARSPSTTRPISLSNTDSKFFALALNRPLAEAATITVHPRQRGFVNGRSLLDNVLEVEGFAQSFAIAEADDPAIILFDIMAAFPSLSHQWLFVVLVKMGIPLATISAFKALYRDCFATIMLMGKRRRRFAIKSGIRQGCPASGTLFALAMDPCIRYLISRIGPDLGLVNAYADDIAAVIRNLYDSLKLVNRCFEIIGQATALHLHPGKVVVVPLWKFDEAEVRQRIRVLVPRLATAKIQDCGKLLGFYIGPGAGRLQFRDVIEELRTRARYLASLNLSWNGVAPLYRSHILSTTCHILQLAPPTLELRRAESSILAVVTKTPANAVPLMVLTRLKDFGLKTDFMSIEVLGKAAAYRAMAGSAVYPRMVAEVARARGSRETNLSPFLREWTRKGALGHLAAVKLHVECIAGLPTESYGLQKWAAKALIAAVPARTLDDCIAKRLTTLLKKKITPEAAACARARICAAKDLVPACTVASMLRTLCNAWTTSGRFFGPTSACPFGCGALEADRFAHFPGCSSLRDLWQEACPGAASFFQEFALETATLTSPMLSTNEVVQTIIWTDVVGQCLNESRANNPPLVVQGLVGKNMIIARLRFLGVQCDATRLAIRSMRS
jgi:exonuclease III